LYEFRAYAVNCVPGYEYVSTMTQHTIVVTGASGYLGSWIVATALAAGHTVRGTVRDTGDTSRTAHLTALAGAERLSLYQADLLDPASFDEPLAGADILIHSASPFIIGNARDPEAELVTPAVEGTRAVLSAATRSGTVRRVVLTSSVAAILGDAADARAYPGGVVDESRWNDTSSITHQPYSYSKTAAERAAWDLSQGAPWSLVTINPAFILGPSLSDRLDGASVSTLRQLGDGSFAQGAPDLRLGFVDVRDVALAHLRAAENERAEGRFILAERVASFPIVAAELREVFGDQFPLPPRAIPKALMWLIAPRVGLTRRYIARNVGHPYQFDARRSREILGITYRSTRETIREHFQQLIDRGVLVPRVKRPS
jgi:nucleoside-diphosphate-sugar epimerase